MAAGLIRAIKARVPNAEFSGVGGPNMLAEGFTTLADMERLSVMGLVEPLKRLPELFALRARLVQNFIDHKPDVFIGIDAPDFNLGLEKKLKANGISTCHYVCPSVWAWRQGRVKKIRQSADHVLALLPFESDFLQQHDIASTFVGHPMAEELAQTANDDVENKDANHLALEEQLKSFVAGGAQLICVMPGSRSSEVRALSDVFLQAIAACLQEKPHLRFVIPAASDALYDLLKLRLAEPDVQSIVDRILLVRGQSRQCMQAAYLVLLASGTATLEAALLGKPMVVAYRLAPLTYSLALRMVKVDHFALPNLLTDKPRVPEFIQHEATAAALSEALLAYLDQPELVAEVKNAFAKVHTKLAQNASEKAADVVLELAAKNGA